MRSLTRGLGALFLCVLIAAASAPNVAAQAVPDDPGKTLSAAEVPIAPSMYDRIPTGARITPRRAIALADATPEVRAARQATPGLRAAAGIALYVAPARYQIRYTAGSKRPVEVHVDPIHGRVVKVFTGDQVDWPLARGEDASINSFATNPWLWVALLALFSALLVDLRRPRSWGNADLLALVAMCASYAFWSRSHLWWSVPLSLAVLLYLALRLGWMGVRGLAAPARALPRWATTRNLLVLLAGLVILRVVLNIVDSVVIDVGSASVVGGDRFIHGQQLYVDNDAHGDVYGPITYLFYGTFVALFPSSASGESMPAAHAAALCWDLLTVLGLLFAGRRLRTGPEGTRLGAAMALAWCAYPLTLYGLASNVNDGLVAALVLGAWLALDSPAGRGALVGLAAAAKFAPAAVAPIFLRGQGALRTRDVAIAVGAAAVAVVLPVVLTLPDGGVRELWNTTLGYQAGRESPFTIWGRVDLGPLQSLVAIIVVIAGIGLAWWPKKRDRLAVAALAAAMLAGVQLPTGYWFYYYVVWFLPLALVAFMGTRLRMDDEPAPPAPREAAAAGVGAT